MQKSPSQPTLTSDRRSFIKQGIAAGAIGVGIGLLGDKAVYAQDPWGGLSKGDAALLRFAAAAEILESDFWIQYNE